MDSTLKAQLVEARGRIAAQLDEIVMRAKSSYEEGPPDLRGVYAELQNQLKEIDALLRNNGDHRDR